MCYIENRNLINDKCVQNMIGSSLMAQGQVRKMRALDVNLTGGL